MGCGENADRVDERLEKNDGLPVGAKPVKNPMTKHNKKWTIAFLYNWTFFFDLSVKPILGQWPESDFSGEFSGELE